MADTLPAIQEQYNATLRAQIPLEQGWKNPPRLARTRVWWWWLNGDTDKPTITRDLEAMQANGIGGANVIDMRALMERTAVDAAGNIVLPEGTSYRILSLGPHDAVSLPVPEAKRRTRTHLTKLAKGTPLEPSGLLGPVRLLGHP